MSEIWKRFDHRLFNLKLSGASQQVRAEINNYRPRIHSEWSRSGQGPHTLYQKLIGEDMGTLRRYMETADLLCRSVWQSQGNHITADFARAVLRRLIIELVETRVDAIKCYIEMLAGQMNCDVTRSAPPLHHLARMGNELKASLTSRYEAEARGLELKKATSQGIASGVVAGSPDRPRLPIDLEFARDPVGGNPFPIEDCRHTIWQKATLVAEGELCRLNSEFLRKRPTGKRSEDWMREACGISTRTLLPTGESIYVRD